MKSTLLTIVGFILLCVSALMLIMVFAEEYYVMKIVYLFMTIGFAVTGSYSIINALLSYIDTKEVDEFEDLV